MSEVDVFSTTLQKTSEWLRDIRKQLGWESDQRAYQALRAVLQTIRDRLPAIEAVHLGSQLPMLIRGMYYEGWSPLDKPIKFTRDEFLMCVATYLPNDPEIYIVPMVRTVVEVMIAHTDPGQINKIARLMPKEFADFWPLGVLG